MEKHCVAPDEAANDGVKPRRRLPKPQIYLINGDASNTVLSLVNDIGIELVVMGTVGRAGIPGWLIGNTAENILAQIDCSVLTVKPDGFVSPVALRNDREIT